MYRILLVRKPHFAEHLEYAFMGNRMLSRSESSVETKMLVRRELGE